MYSNRLFILLTILLFCTRSTAQDAQHPFVENAGQWDGNFLFRTDLMHSSIFGLPDGLRLLMGDDQNRDKKHQYRHGEVTEIELKYHAFDLKFVNGDASLIEYIDPAPTLLSYFLGDEPSKWKSGLHPYASVICKEVWEGVDLVWKTEDQLLKYEWKVAPHADPDMIQIKVEGAEDVKKSFGKLYIETSVGDYIETAPYTYQIKNGERVEINSQWHIKGDIIQYHIIDEYDHDLELIIDPTLIFSTFTGSTADNWGISATYDTLGNFYLGSITSGTGFPMTTGAFQSTYGGGVSTATFPHDITVSKYDPTGANMIYSTYIGGSGDENPNSLIVHDGNLIVSGNTNSGNYPTTASAYDATQNGAIDIVVTKLNANGTALLGSTYIGGSGDDGININNIGGSYGPAFHLKFNYGDDNRSEVNVDDLGNIYIASSSSSANFPFSYSTPASKGFQNAVVLKMNPTLSTLSWAGNYGGNSYDAAYVIDFSKNYDYIYVAGGTKSSNLTTNGPAYQTTIQGDVDGYVMKLSTNNGNLLKTSYFGTSSYDQIYGIQVDDSNAVYITGQTLGIWPVSAGVYSNAGSAQFIQKVDSNLGISQFSTVYGNGTHNLVNISPVAFLVDECGAIFVSGWGGSVNRIATGNLAGFTTGMPVSSNAIKSTTDGSDFYFIALSKNANSLLYASFFGQTGGGGEHVDGGTSRFNPTGQIFQAICANCSSTAGIVFPTTTGSYSTTNNSPNCNAAAVKIDFEYTATVASAFANPDTTGCIPFLVTFTDQSSNATSHYWDFDDGGASSTSTNTTYTYTSPGVYHPFLAVYNPNTCIERDTITLTIIVSDDSLNGDFLMNQVDSCGFTTVSFTQNVASMSTAGLDPSGFTYDWNFGNGNTSNSPNPNPQTYNNQGTFTVTLTVTHPEACNSPLVISHNFTYLDSSSLDINVQIPDSLCLPEALTIINNSKNVTTHYWEFGDGNTSTLSDPTHSYSSAGLYTVKYIATNPLTCNKIDSFTKDVHCSLQPTANFTLDPFPNLYNSVLNCTNNSSNAKSYLWDFGDGNSSTEVHPTHQYNESGTYEICLTAYNNQCADTFCRPLSVIIEPIVDITTGFSPNGDLTNDFVQVNGYGVLNYQLDIYNRWGEKVYNYEGDEIGNTWDGYFRGTLQEADVYAYVLQVYFTDGTDVLKKGNITLIK